MDRTPPTLDMLPDGRFGPGPKTLPLSTKLMIGGAIVAVLAGAIAIAMVAIWLIMMLIPIMIVAGVIAYAAYRIKRWRLLGRPGPLTPR